MFFKKKAYEHFGSLPSTHVYAKKTICTHPLDTFTVITAGEQTAGIGRDKRPWKSPPSGNLYATFCFFLSSRERVQHIGQILSLSALQLIPYSTFKWPNDLFLGGKKLGGVLVEVFEERKYFAVIASIGLNVNMPKEELEQILQPATSLLAEGNREVSLPRLQQEVESSFAKNIDIFLEHGFLPLFLEIKKRLHHQEGDTLSFHENGETRQGRLLSFNEDGSLTLEFIRGEKKTFYAGETRCV